LVRQAPNNLKNNLSLKNNSRPQNMAFGLIGVGFGYIALAKKVLVHVQVHNCPTGAEGAEFFWPLLTTRTPGLR
jgi:hypothetical protein